MLQVKENGPYGSINVSFDPPKGSTSQTTKTQTIENKTMLAK